MDQAVVVSSSSVIFSAQTMDLQDYEAIPKLQRLPPSLSLMFLASDQNSWPSNPQTLELPSSTAATAASSYCCCCRAATSIAPPAAAAFNSSSTQQPKKIMNKLLFSNRFQLLNLKPYLELSIHHLGLIGVLSWGCCCCNPGKCTTKDNKRKKRRRFLGNVHNSCFICKTHRKQQKGKEIPSSSEILGYLLPSEKNKIF